MQRVFFGLVLVLWAETFATAHAANIELALGGWRQDPHGHLSTMVSGRSYEFDLQDDLDYKPEYRLFGRLKLRPPQFWPNIYILAAPMEFEESGQKYMEIRFNGQRFAADVALDSKLTLNQYDLSLYYGIPAVRTASAKKLNVDLGLNLRWIDFSAEITGRSDAAPGMLVAKEKSISIIVPMLFAAVQFMPTERFSIEAEARGLAIGGNSIYSFLGRLRYSLIGPAFIAGGYRHDILDIDEGSIRLVDDFSGPFAELGLKF
jgi:outer membrane protein